MTGAIRIHTPDVTGDTPFAWQDDAACATTDPDLFFPVLGDTQSSQKAREICATCPVIEQCRELGDGFEWGIFGGTTPTMRRQAQGPWRGSRDRQLELAKKGMPVSEIARLCQVSERTVHRTIAKG